MKKRIGNVFGLLAAGVLAAVLLTGCGAQAPGKVATGEMKMEEAAHDTAASASGSMGNYYEGGTELAPMEEAPQVTTMEASAESAALKDRKLIKTVDMSVETKEFDSLMASLERKVEELGGYIESLEVYNGRMYSYDSTSRDASLTLRIPQNKLTDFLNEVSEISNVIHRSERVEDVTLTYVDMESHRDALRTEQDRLLELLKKAESLEDILVIEERLTNIRYQLESMESRLRTMDNQVEYSTVYLSVSEVKELTPPQRLTTGQRIKAGFIHSLQDIAEESVDLFVWFVANLPYLLIWAAVIAIAILILGKLRRRRIAGKAKKAEKDAES